jgi:hypothetical protein
MNINNNETYFTVGDFEISHNCYKEDETSPCIHKIKHKYELTYRKCRGDEIYTRLKDQNFFHDHFDKYEEYIKQKEYEFQKKIEEDRKNGKGIYYAQLPRESLLCSILKFLCCYNWFKNEKTDEEIKIYWENKKKEEEEQKKISEKYKASSRLDKLKEKHNPNYLVDKEEEENIKKAREILIEKSNEEFRNNLNELSKQVNKKLK